MSMAEYVSVSSQADTERADLNRERQELATSPKHEEAELTEIYVKRGLNAELASKVAAQLMKHDALGVHARDELGISDALAARDKVSLDLFWLRDESRADARGIEGA
jgi:VIT1/CCC1 family predicted Fe2+/Mn2+ transporter